MADTNIFSRKVIHEAARQPAREKPPQAEAADKRIALLRAIKKKKEKEVRLLAEIELAVLHAEEAEADRLVKRFLSANEAGFLCGKEAVYARQSMKTEYEPPAWFLRGRPEGCPSSLARISDSHFKFVLPPLTGKKTTEKAYRDGCAIHYLVTYLLQQYESRNGLVKAMERPFVLFIHHVDDRRKACRVPDPDNLEVKTVIDSLQGYFFENDSVLDITLLHAGKRDDSDYTEVHILDSRSVPW